MMRHMQVEVTLPLYVPEAGKCLVPLGLHPTPIDAGRTQELSARAELRGTIVGFTCLSTSLRVMSMRVGSSGQVRFSDAGFDSQAAADGIVIPGMDVEISEEVAATFENVGGGMVCPRAYFWIETDMASRRPRRPGRMA